MTDRRKRGQRTVNGRPLRSANARLVAEHDAALTRIEGLAAQVQTLRTSLAEVTRELESAPGGLRKNIKAAAIAGAHAALAATSGETPHSEEVMPDRPRRTEGDVPRPEESRGAGLHAVAGAAHPTHAEPVTPEGPAPTESPR
jgi:ferric-dicitrate binding protein FerR (iron transport regulator)